jgi:UDP-2,4-diacetamido-2,4,6-trideoxy-beta-L-altropyranose hydrolase
MPLSSTGESPLPLRQNDRYSEAIRCQFFLNGTVCKTLTRRRIGRVRKQCKWRCRTGNLSMQVVFRVDSSSRIGVGHTTRCLALASELARRGAHVQFLSRPYAGNWNYLIREKGFTCHELTGQLVEPTLSNGKQGGQEVFDVGLSETAARLKGIGPIDWLIFDSYGIDARWEAPLRDVTRRIAVIDDLANRKHDADVLVDQNLTGEEVDRYSGLLPTNCIKLLGPRYALLRPEFRALRQKIKHRSRNTGPLRILAFFGGADATRETQKFIEGWQKSIQGQFSADIVIGSGNSRIKELECLARTLKGVRLHHQTDRMAELMANADYAFGASGSSNWERLCLGLGASIVCVAENQIETACALGKLGLADYVGRSEETGAETYALVLKRLADRSIKIATCERMMSYVDGLGTQRVADTLYAEMMSQRS